MAVAVSHIIKTPNVLGGAPRIEGRRIAVHHIAYQHEEMKIPPETIAEEYDLTLGQVYAALSYYHDHREEIDGILAAEDEAYEAGLAAQKYGETLGEQYVPADAAAILLGVKHESRRIAALCREGKLDCQKIANRWIVSRASIERYKAANPGPGRPPNAD